MMALLILSNEVRTVRRERQKGRHNSRRTPFGRAEVVAGRIEVSCGICCTLPSHTHTEGMDGSIHNHGVTLTCFRTVTVSFLFSFRVFQKGRQLEEKVTPFLNLSAYNFGKPPIKFLYPMCLSSKILEASIKF